MQPRGTSRHLEGAAHSSCAEVDRGGPSFARLAVPDVRGAQGVRLRAGRRLVEALRGRGRVYVAHPPGPQRVLEARDDLRVQSVELDAASKKIVKPHFCF